MKVKVNNNTRFISQPTNNLLFSKLPTFSQRQEAQRSQKDRAMFRVIEYFAKSFKVIRNDIVE